MKHNLILFSILTLSACTPDHDDLHEWTTTTRKNAESLVQPFEAPVLNAPKAYIPPISSGLNAFSSQRLNHHVTPSHNIPNFKHRKETLETFSLDQLRYIGSLRSNKGISGFIEAENHTYTVHIGDYVGQNYGKIQEITENEMTLSESVEDSNGNWVYRRTKLPLSHSSSENDHTPPQISTSDAQPATTETVP